jgi:hypothetical protein
MKVSCFCEEPDDDFIQTQSDHTDDREYDKLQSLVGYSSFRKNPEDAQSVIGDEPQSKGDGRRDQIMDFDNICQDKEESEIHCVGNAPDKEVFEKLN